VKIDIVKRKWCKFGSKSSTVAKQMHGNVEFGVSGGTTLCSMNTVATDCLFPVYVIVAINFSPPILFRRTEMIEIHSTVHLFA
jgi:hypothetical protein